MSLKVYHKKRKFDQTPEPEGGNHTGNQNRFVIQRHDATRLHYDLRLEINGVLKSWAVPKGPSMNPKDKRLSIQTEDHPVKYLDFEGTIPKGNYGAGKMNIWDEGIFDINEEKKQGNALQQWKKGNLKIEFHGKKLNGSFALVKMKQTEKDEWLLIKKQDKYATDFPYDAENYISRRKSPPKKLKPIIKTLAPDPGIMPMLASKTQKPFDHPDWIFEPKWDGYRIIAQLNNGKVALYSRNGISYTKKFSVITHELKDIPHNAILDGEVVWIDKKGKPDFQKLQHYDSNNENDELKYYVFDLLHLNGYDTYTLPLLERKSLIPELIEDLENIVFCEHIETKGVSFYKTVIGKGMEGIIAKKSDSIYLPGIRTENWLKVKTVDSQEALICGYTVSDSLVFGSLILGIYQNGTLNYIGNCGTGFSDKERKAVYKKLQSKKIKNCPFPVKPNLKGRKPVWLSPSIIAEISFAEWTKENRLRHPVFKGLREDKTASEITREKAVSFSHSKKPSKNSSLEIDGYTVPFTHLDKIYWPENNWRKVDLIDYYIQISEFILPYLKDKPQNLHRHPNGIAEKGFFQKDMDNIPEFAETVSLYSTSTKKNIDYLLCQNEATLLYMANLGCIEINPWLSKYNHLDYPDYVVIDLDPSEKNTFNQVLETTLAVKEVLDKANIEGYCKTSGSSGMHIYLPLQAQYTYEEARNFAKLICIYVEEQLPKLTSTERAIKNRKGKIYLDFLQNRKAQTVAAPYCVRPKPGATVSTPVTWKEIKKGFQLEDFNIQTVPKRLHKIGDIFKPVHTESIDIAKALEQLNNL